MEELTNEEDLSFDNRMLLMLREKGSLPKQSDIVIDLLPLILKDRKNCKRLKDLDPNEIDDYFNNLK